MAPPPRPAAPHPCPPPQESLGCLPPVLEPRATEFIPQMVAMIERIIANGHAYAVDGGDVFFDVGSLPGYGALSGRKEVRRGGGRAGGAGVQVLQVVRVAWG